MASNFPRRILFDIRLYENEKNNLNREGIFLHYSMEDFTKMILMIIGPEGTPYQDGFYLFDVTVPPNYPLEPPTVQFMTQSDKIRFHPNFYVEGYVCLSVLNTWGSNEWSAGQSIVSIAKTLQSVMNENPITNEPDYENETGAIAQNYAKIVRYYNLKTAICDMIEKCPLRFRDFLPDAKKLFLENYESYLELCENNKDDQDQIITCQTYSLSVRINYSEVKNRLKNIKKNLDQEFSRTT